MNQHTFSDGFYMHIDNFTVCVEMESLFVIKPALMEKRALNLVKSVKCEGLESCTAKLYMFVLFSS